MKGVLTRNKGVVTRNISTALDGHSSSEVSSINLAEDDEIDKGDNDNAEDIHHHAMEISGLPVTEDESLPDIVEQSTEISSDTQNMF